MILMAHPFSGVSCDEKQQIGWFVVKPVVKPINIRAIQWKQRLFYLKEKNIKWVVVGVNFCAMY
jgi:hypothetical protein